MTKGFTLLEGLIAFALVSVVSILLVEIILNSARVYTTQDNLVSGGVELNTALSRVSVNIRESAGVALKYPEQSSTPDFITGGETAVLKLQSIRSDGSIDLLKYDYVVFYRNGKYFKEKLYPDAVSTRVAYDKLVTTFLDSIAFEYLVTDPDNEEAVVPVSPDQADRVKVTISTLSKSGQQQKKVTSSITVSLRN